MAQTFICIADASKLVPLLGAFPLPVEVIPMARSHVARQLVKLGGDPVYREGVLTDNGNIILDVFNLSITNPAELESQINAIVGVVTNGLFAARPADLAAARHRRGCQDTQARLTLHQRHTLATVRKWIKSADSPRAWRHAAGIA